jgi:uncharacterized protein (DUF362 family)
MTQRFEQNYNPSVAIVDAQHYDASTVQGALQRAGNLMGWADDRSPFGSLIPRGARVLIKPNLVLHENQGGWGLESVVTNQSLIRAATEAALACEPSEVLVGDAPVQGCDFDALMRSTGLGEFSEDLAARDPRFKGIRDFRRTTCTFVGGVRVASENLQSEDNFIVFDLGSESLLEPVSDDREAFRVTCYDPRLLARTHCHGKHQYLVARQVIDADVIINLPKLKTHKKAGVTCGLKNLIGINGNKEYLPHHRLGGSETGGDCYPGGSIVKRALEFALDRQNQSDSFGSGRVWHQLAVGLDRISTLMGDRLGVEGSWSGNDTIWRTCLDLNRILLYGSAGGALHDAPQRRVVHLVDAVIAGQGDGPLAPVPLPLNMIVAGNNAAAVDWAGALLLGYDPLKVPLAREAFGRFRWPITRFGANEVLVKGDAGSGAAADVIAAHPSLPRVVYPAGWVAAAGAHQSSGDKDFTPAADPHRTGIDFDAA